MAEEDPILRQADFNHPDTRDKSYLHLFMMAARRRQMAARFSPGAEEFVFAWPQQKLLLLYPPVETVELPSPQKIAEIIKNLDSKGPEPGNT